MPRQNLTTNSYVGVINSSTTTITIPNTTALNFITNKCTISAWIYLTASSTPRTILKKDFKFILRSENQIIKFYTWAGTDAHVTTMVGLIPLFKWHHITAVYDGDINSTKIYVNGILNSSLSTQSGNLDSSTQDIGIGGQPSGGERWSGNISDVILWSTALTSTEISNIALNNIIPGNFVERWRLSEGSGTTIIGVNGNNGTSSNLTYSSVNLPFLKRSLIA